jgi:hypothetical protein
MVREHYRIVEIILIVTLALGCRLLGGGNSSDEITLAPTEVGTPAGNAVTKSIGPAGGTLASPDGRITLTVPQNALIETVAFTIQPITNKAATGLGTAYRLEPSGKVFDTPLQLSIHYDDHDIDGTVPEALSMAYQDGKGAWHIQSSGQLDQSARTLTIPIKHFTDFSFITRLRMVPPAATVHVKESQVIQLQVCGEPSFVDKILSRPLSCKEPPPGNVAWSLRGEGTIRESKLAREFGLVSVIYTAPAKRPTPNIAMVEVSITFRTWNPETGALETIEKTFDARITIVDRGYRATGHDRSTSYSGVICSLDQPFAVMADNTLVSYPLDFVPSSGTAGDVKWDTTWGVLRLNGEGTYTIEGLDTEKPRIIVQPKSTLTGPPRSATGSGTAHIELLPLPIDSNDCGGD